jgi:dTDP-4-amino-4,6-dideoxygalactose transaminase
VKQINCFEPHIGTNEISNVVGTLASGKIGYGEKVKEFEKAVSEMTNSWALAYSSASAAAFAVFTRLYELHGACLVVTPSLTFASPVWAAKQAGHSIHYIDVGTDCVWSANEYRKLRSFRSFSEKIVVMPMLYGGVTGKGRDFGFVGDEIVVVDSAHCLKPEVKFDYAFLSFHSQKPLAMAQGGALLLDSDNWDQLLWFMRFKDFGRERSGMTYKIIQNGFKFYMDNLNASIGLAQYQYVWEHVNTRKDNFTNLACEFDYERLGRFVPHDEGSSYYLCTFILKDRFKNDELIAHLKRRGIQATFHYPELHKSPSMRTDTVEVFESLPVTEFYQTQLVNLPIHQNLTNNDIERIAGALNEFEK